MKVVNSMYNLHESVKNLDTEGENGNKSTAHLINKYNFNMQVDSTPAPEDSLV